MNGNGLRANSRRLGLIFETLSVLTVIGTVYWTIRIYSTGTQLGIGTLTNRVSWSFFFAGMFSALVLGGFGHVLGLLCAIYDRQDLQPRQSQVRPVQPPTPSRDWREQSMSRPPVWESPAPKKSGEFSATGQPTPEPE
jgi:hypothetical protein